MTAIRTQKKPAEAAFLCTAFIFLLFFAGLADYLCAVVPWAVRAYMPGIGDTGAALATAAAVALYAAAFILLYLGMRRLIRGSAFPGIREKIRAGGDGRNVVLLLAVTAVPRIIWLLAGSPPIVSDYALYAAMGREYAETGTLAIGDYILKIASNVPLYAVLLGCVMRVAGTSAAAAQGFCLLLHTASVLLLYGTGRNLTTRGRAMAAALLFSLLPENIFYAALPGIEAPAMFTMLAGLLLITGTVRRKTAAAQVLTGIAGGGLLAFSACLRPNAWAAAAAAAAWLICRFRRRIPARRIITLLAAAAVGAAGVTAWHHAFRDRIFTGEKPAGMALGWPLYEGLDLENAGQWTAEKSARCGEVIAQYSAEESDRIFMTEALERFRGYSFTEKIRMFLRKGGAMWMCSLYAVGGDANDGVRFILPTVLALVSWAVFLMLWMACLVFRGRHPSAGRDDRLGCGLCLAVILLTALWHEFGTSISRYHYMVIPFMALMTAMMAPSSPERREPARQSAPPQ